MQLIIQLNKDNADTNFTPQETAYWIPCLQAAALEVEQMNAGLADTLLVNGPLKCNPEATQIEGYLGDINTPPNEFGYVTIIIENYRKLIPKGIIPTAFDFVHGEAVEDVQVGLDEEGNPIYTQVYGGTFI